MISFKTAVILHYLTEIACHVNAQTIDCDNIETCAFNTFSCDTVNNVDCIIQCLTDSSCREAIFNGGAGTMKINCGAFACDDATFTGGVGNMEINCAANACNYATFNGGDGTMVLNCNQGACSGTTWNGGNGDLIATCTGSNACDEGYKYCPPGKYCNITCDGRNACAPGSIRSGDGNTKINIIASGDEALGEGVSVYCPENHVRGGSPNSCNIYGYNTPTAFIMSSLKIYTIEGLHDVNIICDNGNMGCWEDYQSNTRATLYCKTGWTANCDLSWSNDVDVKCFRPPTATPTAPTVQICEDYLLPTLIPTVQPTSTPITAAPTTSLPTTLSPTVVPTTAPTDPTLSPTPSPTKYNPNNSGRQIVYVSEIGCDYGYCINENYTNYDNETDNFDYCSYGSECCNIPNTIPSCQDTVDTWETSKGPYGWSPGNKIITINRSGIYSGSVIGDDGGEDYTRDLIRIVCFQIESPFICVNPILNLEFEDISYAYNVQHYHFNVSYQNESEVAGCSGGSGTKTCGSWYECPVDVQPIDGPWTPDGSGHAFWVRDSQPAGQAWRPECSDPRRTFNVRVSVNCSAMDGNPPRCRTLDYTWSCFNGIGGIPRDTMCNDAGYDGNGEIKISRGTYTLNDNIYVQAAYQQVVIEGRGFNHTFLNQIISNNNIVISCQLCNLTMKGFTYNIESSGAAASASNIIIEIFNGNTTFDDIVFMSDVQRLKFIFSNDSNVEFTNCRFQKNVTFDVSNGATVSFRKCMFMNISGNVAQQDSIIRIENSILLITNTVFANNNAFDSIIESSVSSNIAIQDSMFIKNRNINYVWYLFESNGSMKNTTNHQNECKQDYCISSVDSDLLIDEISIVDYYTNVSDMLEFGHDDNDTTNFNTLYLYDFNPQEISTNIDFLNFHVANGKIIFVPCNRFEDSLTQHMIFDVISMGLIPTRIYNKSGAFDGEALTCNTSAMCYIKCVAETLTCFRSSFTAVSVEKALFKCTSSSSCQEGKINVSSSITSAILCDGVSACEKMKIYVSNTSNFTLECVMTGSCTAIEIFITNTSEANIKCFAQNACDRMRVTSDSNEIDIYIETWSEDIIINVPSDYIPEYLHCNDKAYLSLDGVRFNSLQTSLVNLFGNKMPCEDVAYVFQSDTVQCEIRYQMFSNNEINEILTYLEDYMECYPPIYINKFLNYSCFGSESPTKFPTIDPTFKPTLSPTSAPSISPTSAPTQYPTSSDAFGDKWIDILYDIKYLTIANLQAIITDILLLKKNEIERFISEGYVESGTDINLEYRAFGVVILQLNGIDTNSKNLNINKLKETNEKIWPDESTARRLTANDLYNVRLTTHIDVDSILTGSAIGILSDSPDFVNITRSKLIGYFDNDNVEFIVNPNNAEFEIKQRQPEEENDILLYVLAIFVTVIMIITLAAFIYNQASTKADNSNYLAVMIYGLQIWDMVSDFILSFEITNKLLSNTSNVFLLIASVGSVTFVVVPYFCNLLMAVNIKKFIHNTAAKSYLETRSSFFITLCTFSGGAYASLSLISSQIFGLAILDMGLTQYELLKLGKLKIFGTILLENLPQMIFQLLYVYALQTTPTENTWLAFITSLLSIISSILTYWMNKSSFGEGATTEYYISFENKDIALNKENKKKISKNKLNTRKLTVAITSEFGIYDRDIEIGYCRYTGHGLNYHIVHHLHEKSQVENPKIHIMELYSNQEHFDKINEIFDNHFEFRKLQNADSTFSVSIQHKEGDNYGEVNISNKHLIDNIMRLLSDDAVDDGNDANKGNFAKEASKLLERFMSETNVDTAMTAEVEMQSLSEYELINNEVKEEGDLKTEEQEQNIEVINPNKIDVTVCDVVQLIGHNLVGRIRFIGNIIGKKGVFYGIELNEADGKNDGSVNNVCYFRCDENKGIFVRKSRIQKRINQIKIGKVRANCGDIVRVKKFDCDGIIRYIGTPSFKKGIWYGVQLDEAKGKNNGTVQGRQYFKCRPNFGTFVSAENVITKN